MSWTGLPKFADDTVTDYSRPSPTIESTSGDDQNKNHSVTKTEASPSTISPKPFIKFVKAAERSTTNKVDTVKKPFVKKNKACFNCGYFDHLSYNCGLGVKMGRSSPKNNYTHKSMPSRPTIHRPYRPPMRPVRPNMNGVQPKRTYFHKPAHLYVRRPFQETTQDLMIILIQRVQRLERELKVRTPIHKVDRGRSRPVMAWVPKMKKLPLLEEVPTARVILPLLIVTAVSSKFLLFALRLDDAESIDCLPNEEIFIALSWMGYEKPSTKLTFYKAFFSPQWKFLIHTILQCMSAKRTSWNEFSSSMASAVICLSTGRKFNFSKYIFDSLLRNVDSFTKFYMVGKGFFGVDTPLFEGMIVAQQADDVADEGAADVDADDVPAAEPLYTITYNNYSTTTTITRTTFYFPKTCTNLTRRVEHLEQDKIAQTLEIAKLKQQVKKLERRNKLKVSKLRRLKKVGTAQKVDTYDDTVMDDVSKQREIIATMDADEDVTLKDVAVVAKEVEVKQDAEIEKNADDDELEPAELKEVVEVVTTAKFMTKVKKKRSSLRDPKETATPSIIIHSEPKSKDKGKGIMVQEPKPLKKKTQIEQDKAYERELGAELNKNINWDDVIEQVQRKEKKENAVMRNMDGFKMDYFKGMSYDDIRLIFEKYFNYNVAFLEKTKEHLEEEESSALKRKTKSQAEKASNKQKLDEEVPVVDYEIYTKNNKPYYKIIRADGSPQLFLSFLSLLRNFDREDLEVIWKIVKERFASSKPKNFLNDFLLTTLTYTFEKPDVQAQVWKNQRTVYGLAKVKSWRLLESYGVHIIKFTTTQMILLVESRYLLTRFTLDQMLNNVILEVKEESEVSLELLRFVRQQQQEGFRPE
nr:synaptobrevin, longin-like domain protein [Tanacetum cinerariifolium]